MCCDEQDKVCFGAVWSCVAVTAQLLQRPQRFTSETFFPPCPVAVLRLPVFHLALGRDEQMSKRLWTDFVFLPTQRYTK